MDDINQKVCMEGREQIMLMLSILRQAVAQLRMRKNRRTFHLFKSKILIYWGGEGSIIFQYRTHVHFQQKEKKTFCSVTNPVEFKTYLSF